MSSFRKAERKVVPLKLAIQGVSFSGKTMSSIKLAHGLAKGKPVFVIDTENDSASLYDHLDFQVASIKPPFKPDKYIELIRDAVDAGAGAIVVDSLSHAWQYILDYKDTLDRADGKQNWGNWAKAKPLWQTLKDAILQSPVHMVCTFREKAEYAVDFSDDGRNKRSEVRKLGTKAVAEEGSEYEFTTVWKLDKDTHIARVEKDRSGLFDGRALIIDEGVGREILLWLGDGDIEVSSAWTLLAAGVSDEFQHSSEQAEAIRKDQARAISIRLKLKPEVIAALRRVAQNASVDYLSLIIDADRYGATDADRLIRYFMAECRQDPLEICRMQSEGEKPKTTAPATKPEGKTPEKNSQSASVEEPQGSPAPGSSSASNESSKKSESNENSSESGTLESSAAREKDAQIQRFYLIASGLGWDTQDDELIGAAVSEILGVGKIENITVLNGMRLSRLVERMEQIKLGEMPAPKCIPVEKESEA